MKKFSITELLISVAAAELTGALSALIAGDFQRGYEAMVRPPLSPPGFVFPVVWTVLYALMGISAYLIYRTDADDTEKTDGIKLYISQLALNFLWSIVYFRLDMKIPGAIIIAALIITVFAMIMQFSKINKTAALLNIHYLLWLIFALYLNIGTVVMNR